jgi:hypothetical protein
MNIIYASVMCNRSAHELYKITFFCWDQIKKADLGEVCTMSGEKNTYKISFCNIVQTTSDV